MQKGSKKEPVFPKQTQKRPGVEDKMKPTPVFDGTIKGSDKLLNKKCIITGGDSGIGRAVAVAFAKEGADVAIVFLDAEKKDAETTAAYIKENYQRDCILFPADISKEKNCERAVKSIMKKFGKLDILVNNAAVQYEEKDFSKITSENLLHTFSVNIFSFFRMTQVALEFMQEGSCIINTTSVTAYRGSGGLIDYSATKGAIVSFTRSLSANLVKKGIRVNAVAPGPVWTPLIVSSFSAEEVSKFGTDCPMGRAAQPAEIAPAYVFLGSEDAAFITGQVIHVNGGEIING